ncbi:MAG: nuclear transport factor 2 family protein [Phycisphaeraceae bacterium]
MPQPPPLLPHLLFEQPVPLLIVLGAATLALILIARRRNDRRLLVWAGGVTLLALAVVVMSKLVVTQRERLNDRTRELVAATAPLDVAHLRTLFAPDAVLLGPEGQSLGQGEEILARLDMRIRIDPIQRQDVRNVQAQVLSDREAVTYLELKTTFKGGEVTDEHPTTWLITWTRQPDGAWQMRSARWMTWRGQPAPLGWF